jgi:hypothetical protein
MPPSVASPVAGDLDSAFTIQERKGTRRVPHYPRHRPLRLPGYEYSQDGAYFVTVCTNLRVGLFGAIHAGVFTPNEAGTSSNHSSQP